MTDYNFAKNYENIKDWEFKSQSQSVGESDNFVDNPLTKFSTGEDIPDDIKALCTTVWTTSVKNAWKANLIANKSGTP